MRVCVYGLWHLGCVTAACLSRAGHAVVGLDPDAETVTRLQQGQPPIFEPGLAELIVAEQSTGRLRFARDPREAEAAEVVWVTFDTPVDEDDTPQPEFVVDKVVAIVDQIR